MQFYNFIYIYIYSCRHQDGIPAVEDLRSEFDASVTVRVTGDEISLLVNTASSDSSIDGGSSSNNNSNSSGGGDTEPGDIGAALAGNRKPLYLFSGLPNRNLKAAQKQFNDALQEVVRMVNLSNRINGEK